MKKNLKAVFSIMLALVMALAALPVSALPRFEAENATVKNAVAPCWTVPNGYRAHDYNKCAEFLEQEDDVGIKNGIKLNPDYDPSDPNTWGFPDYSGDLPFVWTYINGQFWLERVNLGYNVLSELCGVLDLSGCGALSSVTCERKRVSAINLRNCFSLDELIVDNFFVPWTLDISYCTSLVSMETIADYLYTIDASGCTALEDLVCYNNDISELNVSGCTALEVLWCYNNHISELNVSGCTALWWLDCYSNNLTELDVSSCTALRQLDCSSNNLTELDVTQNTALVSLDCASNNLTELDVTQKTALVSLDCSYNNLTELDITNNTELLSLKYSGNNLAELDVSQHTGLRELYCSDNGLTELDISNLTELRALSCVGNNLVELDLHNSPRLPFDYIRAEGNGYIGYSYDWEYDELCHVWAKSEDGATFHGFFDESGEINSAYSSWDENGGYYTTYQNPQDIPTGTIIARFSGGALPGDIDGSGSVSTADAITTLRLAMQLLDGNGMNTDAADMDGNGSITLADAILILRTAMGLA